MANKTGKMKLPKGYYQPEPLAGPSEWHQPNPAKDGDVGDAEAGTTDPNVYQPGKAPARPKRPKALGYFKKGK